jgi:PAS domain S-box-containing protein
MNFVRTLTMKAKLTVLAAVFAVGFLAFGIVAFATLNIVKVNGPNYQRIVQNKDLLADVLPPPNFIVESYLITHILLDTKGTPEYATAVEKLRTLQGEYETRLEYWKQNLPESTTKDELVEKATGPARKFFDLVDKELIPAVDKGDRAAADLILTKKLPPLYAEHRAAIDRIVLETTKNAAQTEASVAAVITWATVIQMLLGAVFLTAVSGFTFWLRGLAWKQEQQDADYAGQIAAISKAQAVIEFKLDGTVITANEKLLAALGYTLEEVRGGHHSQFVDEAHKQSAEYQEFWSKLHRGEYVAGEFKWIGKEGQEVWFQASFNPIMDLAGKPYKVVNYASDITGMIRLRSEAARVQSMMEQAPINVMFAGPDFKISYANLASLKTLKSLQRFLPIQADQIIGQSIDMFHKRPEQQRQLLADPKNLPHQAQIQIGPETFDLLVSPIFDGNRSFLGTMVTWEMITQKLKSEQDVKDAAARDQEKAAALAEILGQVNSNAKTLGVSAQDLTAVSTQMAANAEQTANQANMVSAASEQVSKNVLVVSTGVEEMNAAIREIAKSASESARVSQGAVTAASSANATISKLGDSSAEIGKVIKVITSIAEQTNLLALNATIEAARAGEAGKGFAVVANEVKELAKETAKATEDISNKIEAIQGDTTGAVESIKQISLVIGQINDISNTIASAVEEQTATANEMSRNVAEAAKGTSEIARNITSVAQAAEDTNRGATNCQQAAGELARMAAELQQLGEGAGESYESDSRQVETRGSQSRNAKKNAPADGYAPAGKA